VSGLIAFFGAPPDTGNLGVSALCFSVLAGLRQRGARRVTVFDHTPGAGPLDGWDSAVRRAGACRTRRWYRPESHAAITACLRLGLSAAPAAVALRDAQAILDISGGDSFTDLYGPWRFRSVIWPKQIALQRGIPLVLLPQTYGPFNDPGSRRIAAGIVRGAASCWARDLRSFDILRDLLGDAFDPQRHRVGVDVAFGLERLAPPAAQSDAVSAAMDNAGDAGPLVGLNISGLIHNDPEKARTRYRFRADYRAAMRGFVERLVADGARVLLVPHVVTPPGHYESDADASRAVVDALDPALRGRVTIAPEFADPRHAKWLIARCDWFCGTRMHATIAGLSSGTPTAAVAYSDKTRGVFETCAQGGEVVDPREVETSEVVERLWDSYQRRQAVHRSLAEHLPDVLAQAERQMDEIVRFCAREGEQAAGEPRPRMMAQATT